MTYDKNNIFAKILRGEIPCKKIYENEYVLSFYDVNPKKKIHVLVIPKGEYTDLDDFSLNASEKEISELIKAITLVAKKLGISINGGEGYRALANIGSNGGQEVPHLHFHLFGGEKIIFTHGGRKSTGIDAMKFAEKMESMGAGEILLTSMDRDGTKKGYDLDLTKKVSNLVNIPVIASGGVGSLEHLRQGIKIGKANAVLAASIFHFGEFSIQDAKKYLDSKGIPVRI